MEALLNSSIAEAVTAYIWLQITLGIVIVPFFVVIMIKVLKQFK